jgi:hypothetical protein
MYASSTASHRESRSVSAVIRADNDDRLSANGLIMSYLQVGKAGCTNHTSGYELE